MIGGLNLAYHLILAASSNLANELDKQVLS